MVYGLGAAKAICTFLAMPLSSPILGNTFSLSLMHTWIQLSCVSFITLTSFVYLELYKSKPS